MILLMGPPGSGKSTQAEMLADEFGLRWVSIGNILREMDDPVLNGYMERGELIPSEVAMSLVARKTQSSESEVVIDDFPKGTEETKMLAKFAAKQSSPIRAMVLLTVGEDEILTRLAKRGRTDDDPGLIKKRLKIFQKETAETIDYLDREFNLPLCRVNGIGTVQEVHERVAQVLRDAKVF